jgi:hypothetical protein
VDTTTIQKCFAIVTKVVFTCSDAGAIHKDSTCIKTASTSDGFEGDDKPLLVVKIFGCEFKNLVAVDESLKVGEEVN